MGASFASGGGMFDDGTETPKPVSDGSIDAAPPAPVERRGWGGAVKRAIDVMLASVGLVLTTPLLALAAIAIRVESRGRAIFRQERLGLEGRPFTMFKLRTMVVGNDDSAHRRYVAALINGEGERHDGIYKLTRDPRLTRVGRVLRLTSVDEVPQLLNVIRGEMSLVGPRPPIASEAKLYDARDWGPLAQRPGITGLWQVSGRCELTYREMIELDLEYVRTWSIWLDIRILLRTPRTILSRRGAG